MGACGEMAFGAARGVSDLIYVKAATGLGAGIVVDGRLVRGGTGIAGEIGERAELMGAVAVALDQQRSQLLR